MSQRIIYKCDRCGATAETSEEKNGFNLQLVAVGIKKYHHSSYGGDYNYFNNQLRHEQQWCWKCCKEVGFVEEKKEEIPILPKPTLEELIREFIEQTVWSIWNGTGMSSLP